MSDPCRISVIIPNYDGREFLESCLTSVTEQDTAGADIEIIVIDNDSHDGSAALVREKFPEVKLQTNDCNKGFTAALNQGVASAEGEWVLLLNNDTRMVPGALQRLYNTLSQAPENCAGVQPLLIRASQPGLIDSAGIQLSRRFRASDRRAGLPVDLAPSETEEIWGACAACVLLRKRVFDRCGGFDPDYFADFDDVDFCLRARWLGYHFLIEPAARVLHHRSPTQRRVPESHLKRHRRNQVLTILKSLPRGMRWRQFLYRLQRDLLMAIHYYRNKELRIVIASWCEAFHLWKRVRSRRGFLSQAKLSHRQMRLQLSRFMRTGAS